MKTKKTGKTMRVAGLLLALVLVTSCFVGGTFAKYVTSGRGDDSARVAKFGVKITANGTTFAKEYATDDESVSGTIAKSVVSSDTSKLVAPGTKGNMVSMTLTGTPEVAVRVQYTATLTLNDNWKDADGKFYCPLHFKIPAYSAEDQDWVNMVVDGTHFDNAEALRREVENRINAFSATYEAGTPLNSLTAADHKAPSVSWEWPFEDTAAGAKQTDIKDTYLGDQAAEGKAAEIQLTVVTTVTQVN